MGKDVSEREGFDTKRFRAGEGLESCAQVSNEDKVVQEFGHFARSQGPEMDDRIAKRLEDRTTDVNVRFRTAHHDEEAVLFRGRPSPADGRVNDADTEISCCFAQPKACLRMHSRMNDQDAAFRHPRKDSF